MSEEIKYDRTFNPYDCRNNEEFLSSLLQVHDNTVVVLTNANNECRKKETQLRPYDNDYRNKI
jgi:hypothetical protein